MGQQQRRAAAVDLVIDVDPVPIDPWHRDFLAASRRIWLPPYSSASHATRGNAHAGKLTSRLPSGVGGRIQRQLYDKIIAATHNVDFANLFSSTNSNLDCLHVGTRSFLPPRSASTRWVSDHKPTWGAAVSGV